MIWRQKLISVLCLTLLLLFATMGDRARAGGTLRTAGGDEPETLDPARATGALARHIGLDLFEGLTAYGSDGAVVPGIATSWETSPDGLRWIFHLRPDAKWSNGEPLNSEDFLYSLRRLVDPATTAPYRRSAGMIVNAEDIIAGRETDLTRLGVEAPDAKTLIINLRKPVPSLLAQLATRGSQPARPSQDDRDLWRAMGPSRQHCQQRPVHPDRVDPASATRPAPQSILLRGRSGPTR
jgi:oligopeptide transport system substrate-binding protein